MFGLTSEYPFNHPTIQAKSVPYRRKPSRPEPYAAAGVEPKIDDILNDPLMGALMQRDGVSMSSLRALIEDTRGVLLSRSA